MDGRSIRASTCSTIIWSSDVDLQIDDTVEFFDVGLRAFSKHVLSECIGNQTCTPCLKKRPTVALL